MRRAARILLSALALGAAASPLAGAVTAQPIIVGERTPAKTYALGQLALMRGDLSLAVRDLAEALRQNPSDVVLRRRVFELSLAAGDFVRALPLARQIIVEDPSNGFANYVLIADAARRGDWKSIDGRVNQLTTVGLDAALAPVIRAWSLRGQGRDAAADEALAVLDRTPSLRSLRALHQAYLDAARGQTEAALTAMTIALADPRLADARVLQSAAALHQQRKAFPEARALLSRDRAAERAPRLSQALELLNSGYALGLAVANPREAIADAFLRASLESRTNSIMPTPVMLAQLSAWITPSVPEAWLRLSSTLNEVGADGAALTVLDNVPRDGALRLSADLQRAQLLEASGQAQRALDLLDTMAKAQPTRADIAVLRADMLRRAGRYADAAPAYTAAMAILGEVQPRDWSALFGRGIAHERAGLWPQAEADLRQALKLRPDDPNLLNYLGFSLLSRKDKVEEATRMVERAAQLRPGSGHIVDSLGWARFLAGRYEDAVETLERALEMEPGSAEINEHLGDAYWMVGREIEARFRWQAALEADAVSADDKRLADKLEFGLTITKGNGGQP